ncbi:predicted protein [Nematostella vectensis]|uniref:Uncharacterized protein n=1 Tax=Nematostella vectensis TaxID=45351 RepID=A7RHW6_NEMVE|nr:predicted protein [Nematostella vectensis]|eukprot:XP_001640989.1 predicted protein [Nematostella vectensis]
MTIRSHFSCFARNQDDSITQQLENGIRSIEIDTCSKEEYVSLWEQTKVTTTYSCRKVLFADPVESILKEIDQWLNQNPREIVVISFTRNYEPWNERTIARDIEDKLRSLWWDQSPSSLSMNDEFATSGRWPTLGDAVRRNQRVFVFVHPKLASHMGTPSWAHNPTIIAPTETAIKYALSNKCRKLVPSLAKSCLTAKELVSVDLYLTKGLPVCTTVRAGACNRLVLDAARACYNKRKSLERTVNFLKIDFPGRWGKAGYKALKEAEAYINNQNLETFTRTDVDAL